MSRLSTLLLEISFVARHHRNKVQMMDVPTDEKRAKAIAGEQPEKSDAPKAVRWAFADLGRKPRLGPNRAMLGED